MKKKEQEIAVNLSSGAEKVERIERKKETKNGERVKSTTKSVQKEMPVSAQGDAAMGDSVRAKQEEKKKKQTEKDKKRALKAKERAEKERKAAEARVAAALKKKEEKEKKAQQRKERQERLKKEREERKRAHARAKANRRKDREQQRKNRAEKGGDRKSYGGWLAAVIALSAVTLALGTTMTIGAIELKSVKEDTTTSYRSTMYELTGILEHVDDDLDRVRVSASPSQQSRILTDLLVQSRLAEMDLERLPIEAETDRNTTVFLNRTAHTCERLLGKLRKGGELTEEDLQGLENLYAATHRIRTQLDEYIAGMQDSDIMTYIKKGEGSFSDMLTKLEEVTLEENRAAISGEKERMDRAGMQQTPIKAENGIDTTRAEKLCAEYFSEYNVAEFQCVGETILRGATAYNVQGYDASGTLLFARIAQKDGALVGFDYYADCNGETFDRENARTIAENFLDKLGYSNMQAVRARQNGTTEDITFVYTQDGVVCYPDMVRVKVCRTRGVVSGFDAGKFLQNHKDRGALNVKITLQQAQDKLSKKLTVEHSRLALVEAGAKERTAYEFYCSYGEEKYLVYLSAQTGEEISILNVNGL